MADPAIWGRAPILGAKPTGTSTGARMVGTVNDAGSGDVVELPTNSGSVEFGAAAVTALSYDTGGYTTGHGLTDGRFIIPSNGTYRVTAHLGFQYFNPADQNAKFRAWLAIDGDHGFPDALDPRRVWAEHRSPDRPDNSQTEIWTPVLTMTEAFTAGELVSCYGRFDAVPSQVGESGWGGIIAFEIESS